MSEKAAVVAPPVRGKNQELWVGLFVIIGTLTTVYLLLTLTDAAMFRGRYIVSSTVKDASGVRKGDPVQMRGVGIGRVQKFLINSNGVKVYLEIEGEYSTIPADSHVELVSAGLLGGMVARVIPGTATEVARNGSELAGEIPASIQQQADDIAGEAKKTLTRVQTLLSDPMIKDTQSSIKELDSLLKRLSSIAAEQQKELKTLTTSMREASQNIEKATSREEIDRAMKRLDTLSASAERTSVTIESSTKALDAVLGRIQRGEGTLGKLSTDDTLYKNLNKTLESVDATALEAKNLLADLKANPKKYLKVSVF
ncbi:MAG TPA: MlaD family protein [Vicinamibacteria bacterium]|nr:MlaD family protein [Vicinamibacteria bacterium]